jgi:hypothetical protein
VRPAGLCCEIIRRLKQKKRLGRNAGQACDDAGNDGFDSVAVQVAENISQYMPEPGESRDGVHDIFSTVQAASLE